MRTTDMYISSLGSFLPETVTVARAVEKGLYSAEEAEVHELGGAAVAGAVPAPEMGLRAAENAVKRAGMAGDTLDLLLYCSTWLQGPEGWLPHPYVQRHLVGGAVPAMEIRQGCNGMFSALELAANYLRAEPQRESALLVAADNFGTPLMDRWQMGPGFVTGDAASAVVLSRDSGFARMRAVASITVPEAEQVHRGREPLFPPGVAQGRGPDFTARFQDITAMVAEDQDPALGPALVEVREQIPELVSRTLDEANITLDDVTRVAFLNCSREATEQRCLVPLGIPLSRSTWEFGRNIGHCGASDQILSFEHLVNTGELGPGDHLLMLGTAPGVILSAAVVEVLRSPEW